MSVRAKQAHFKNGCGGDPPYRHAPAVCLMLHRESCLCAPTTIQGWQSRFKSVLVEEGIAAKTMAAYIDLNPVRAGIVADPAD